MVVRKLRHLAPQSLSVDLEAVVSQQSEIRRAARAVAANPQPTLTVSTFCQTCGQLT